MVAMASKAKADEKICLKLKSIRARIGWWRGSLGRTEAGCDLLQRMESNLYSESVSGGCVTAIGV